MRDIEAIATRLATFSERAASYTRLLGAIAARPFQTDPDRRWRGFDPDAIAAGLGAPGLDPRSLPPERLDASPLLDPDLPALRAYLQQQNAIAFPHDVGSFDAHLLGTWRILSCWRQPREIARGGCFHSIYGTDVYPLALVDLQQREAIATLIGASAEALVFLFCTLDRRDLRRQLLALGQIPDAIAARNWATGETLNLPATVVAAYLVVELANTAEQSCRWGKRPGLWLHRASELAALLPGHWSPLPPIFGCCSQQLDRDCERAARRSYLQLPHPLTPESHETLQHLSTLNPWIAEPHYERAQLDSREAAALAAQSATERLWAWGTTWDKRRSWVEMVATLRAR